MTGFNSDRVFDFSQLACDRLDLSRVDAITGGADDAFVSIDTDAFSVAAGELRFEQSANFALVTGDLGGDSTADFAIRADGVVAFDASDFIF